jgi:hypothetical protein
MLPSLYETLQMDGLSENCMSRLKKRYAALPF